MERRTVDEKKSSQVRSIGYEKEKQVLQIEFSSGGVYDYFGVPESVYEEFIHAESLGQFVGTRIRGAYEYKRLHSDGRTRISKCEDPACWCMKLTKSWYEPKEKPSEKEKPKKADKKTRKIS